MADAAKQATRVALRAQCLDLASRLEPFTEYEVRTWLEKVGSHSVVVGHAVSQRHANGDIVDIARGSAALVFLERRGAAMEVPKATRLRELAAPSVMLRGYMPVNDVHAASPEAMAEVIGPTPRDCWNATLCVPAVDLDVEGRVQQAACIAYLERIRFGAVAEGGYQPAAWNERILRAYTLRAFVAYLAPSMQGNRIKFLTWGIPAPATGVGLTDGCLHLAFEVQAATGGVRLLHGLLVVASGGTIGIGARL